MLKKSSSVDWSAMSRQESDCIIERDCWRDTGQHGYAWADGETVNIAT